MRRLALVMLALSLLLPGISSAAPRTSPVIIGDFSSYETGWEGWVRDATDIPYWNVTRTTGTSTDGRVGAKFTLHNTTAEGRVWLEHAFTAHPNVDYNVSITFDVTRACGDNHLGYLIAGATTRSPEVAADLEPLVREPIENGKECMGVVWERMTYTTTVRSDESGRFYVVYGFWGTFEGTHTYYSDAVTVLVS